MKTILGMEPCTQLESINQIKTDVREIKSAFLGSEFNPDGFLQQIAKAKADIKSIKGRIIYFAGISAGVGTSFGFLLGKIWK